MSKVAKWIRASNRWLVLLIHNTDSSHKHTDGELHFALLISQFRRKTIPDQAKFGRLIHTAQSFNALLPLKTKQVYCLLTARCRENCAAAPVRDKRELRSAIAASPADCSILSGWRATTTGRDTEATARRSE